MSSSEDKRYPILPVLRYALWGEASDELKSVPWKMLMQTATEQAVFGLAFCAFEKIGPKDFTQPLLFEYIGLEQQIEKGNRCINSVLQRFIEDIRSQEIDICVVKGQVVGTCYPNPIVRQSGDIDFWVRPNNIDKCEAFIKKSLYCEIHRSEAEKHVEFQWEGIQFEVHNTLASFSNGKNQRYFDGIIESDTLFAVEINGNEVLTLSPTINALYIFIHLFHHMIDTGVGLRQFCDWMMWLHRYKEDINRKALIVHLRALELEKPYRVLGAILIEDLGLPEEEFPLAISDKDRKRSRKVLKDVIEMGNFGHNKSQVCRLGVLHSIQTGLRMFIQEIKYFDLAPKEIAGRLPKTFCWYLKK